MTDERLNALDDCLRQMQAGESLEAALARYPALADELRPMLEAAQLAQPPAEAQAVPNRAQRASRAAFLTRAAELREAKSKARSLGGFAWPRAIPRAFAAALAASLVVALGAYGVVSVSASSLPGDPLYGVKRTAEDVQLFITVDPAARAALEGEFDERRVQETERVLSEGREAEVEFSGAITALLGDLWRVGEFSVRLPSNTPISGTPAVGRWAKVVGLAQKDGTVEALRVTITEPRPTALPAHKATPTEGMEPEPSHTATPAPGSTAAPTDRPQPSPTARAEEIEFTGVLASISGDIWTIDDQAVLVTRDTEIRGDPHVGQVVEVRAVRTAGGALIALRIRVEDEREGSSTPVGAATRAPGRLPSDTPKAEPSRTPEATRTREATRTLEPSRTPSGGPSPSNTPHPTQTPAPTETQRPTEVEFEGVVQSTGEVWMIAGQSVIVTRDTEIRGDPRVGDMVRVRALKFPDGRLVAVRIEKRS